MTTSSIRRHRHFTRTPVVAGRAGTAPLRFFSANHAGAMLAVYVPADIASRLALPGGEDPEDMHITLFYFGDAADVPQAGREAIIYTALGIAANAPPLEVVLDGVDVFEENEERPLIARVASPALEALRADLARAFDEADIEYSKDYEYQPHVTIKYLNQEPVPPVQVQESFTATAVEAVFAQEHYRLSLFQARHHAARKGAGQSLRIGSGDYEGVANRQQRALVKAYDSWSVKARKALNRAAERGASESELNALLARQMKLLEESMADVVRAGVLKAARVAAGAHVDDDAVQRVVRDEIAKNQALVRENLIPNVNSRILPALAAGAALAPLQLRLAFNNIRPLPAQYAGTAWVAIFEVQKGLGRQRESERRAAGETVEKVRWVLDSRAEHCHATPGYYGCPDLAREYPGGWDSLPTVPAGQVTCRGNCRCHLEVYRDGEWRRGIYDD